LDEDILALADQIRRERSTKRERAEREKYEQAQAQQEIGLPLTRQKSWVRRGLDEKPLVGNLIGEDHVNYVLMYNMLTGIRIAVGIYPITVFSWEQFK
jgi:1-phosphatidylinositol-4-phosphate 5-kinase